MMIVMMMVIIVIIIIINELADSTAKWLITGAIQHTNRNNARQ